MSLALVYKLCLLLFSLVADSVFCPPMFDWKVAITGLPRQDQPFTADRVFLHSHHFDLVDIDTCVDIGLILCCCSESLCKRTQCTICLLTMSLCVRLDSFGIFSGIHRLGLLIKNASAFCSSVALL